MDFDFLLESITPTQTTNLVINATGSLAMPLGTTAQRGSPLTAGSMRWNSDTPGMETWNGAAWVASAGAGTVTSVAVTGSTGLTVGGSAITTSGTITLTLNTELQGLSDLAANGVLARTAAGTYAARTIAGTASNIVVTNGDGVAGAPTINLATAGTAVTNLFQKITTDAYGRVTATSAVVAGDITGSLGYTPINKAGDTAIGSLTLSANATITVSGTGTITGLPATPAGSSDAASKAYVDSVAQGLNPKAAVHVATTADGALATAFANGQTVDGVALVTGNRILLKNQSAPAENGVYTVNASGAPTRALDVDTWAEVPSAFLFVQVGTANADTGWVCISDAGGTLNTTAINFTQFGGAGTYTAGTGLTLSGTQFSITSPIVTTLGGTGMSTIGTANQLLAVNNGATGLEYKTISSGTGLSVTPGAGTVVLANTGVTSAVAGTAISVSGATGAVTITNTGVTALAGTANQVTASAATGSITLSLPNALVAPGSVAVSTALFESTSAAVTAAGSTQGTATALTASYNVITVAAANSGVVLPVPASPGWSVTIVNRGANPLNVYPNAGGAIDGAGANAAIVVPVNDVLIVQNSSATQWFTTESIITAGAGISVVQGNGLITVANTGVTSVGLTLPGFLTVSGSPVTTTGTLSATLASQTANTIFAAPNGSAGSPTFRTLVYADLPTKLYVENPSAQTTPTAAGTNAVAIGSGSTAPAANALAMGDGTAGRVAGGKVFANGKFATAGDAQHGIYVLRNVTTTASATELFLDGVTASQRLAMVDNSTYFFKIDIAARRTDAVGGSAGYTFTGIIKRDVGVATTALVGTVSKTVVAETNAAWNAAVTADATNGSIKIDVTGEAAKTIRWVATAHVTEVTN